MNVSQLNGCCFNRASIICSQSRHKKYIFASYYIRGHISTQKKIKLILKFLVKIKVFLNFILFFLSHLMYLREWQFFINNLVFSPFVYVHLNHYDDYADTQRFYSFHFVHVNLSTLNLLINISLNIYIALFHVEKYDLIISKLYLFIE